MVYQNYQNYIINQQIVINLHNIYIYIYVATVNVASSALTHILSIKAIGAASSLHGTINDQTT